MMKRRMKKNKTKFMKMVNIKQIKNNIKQDQADQDADLDKDQDKDQDVEKEKCDLNIF